MEKEQMTEAVSAEVKTAGAKEATEEKKPAAKKAAAKKTTTAKKTAAARKAASAENAETEEKPAAKKTTTRKTTAKKTTTTKKAASTTKKAASAENAETEEKPAAKKTTTRKTTAKKTTTTRKAASTTKKTTTTRKAASTTKKTTTKKTTTKKAAAAKKDNALKVLFVTPECTPFAHSGGLGDVAGSLPKALCRKGVDCRVIMPLYGTIKEEYRNQMEYVGYTFVNLKWRSQYLGLFMLEKDGVKYYFIDNEFYFKRDTLYGQYDDGERFSYFSKAVFDALRVMDFEPNVIHANDWQSALVPVYQNSLIRKNFVKTVFTIHNIQYQGAMSGEALDSIIDIPFEEYPLVIYNNHVNLMKGACEACNAITTVSPSYAEELKYPANAFGLDDVIRHNEFKMRGIINGIDMDVNDPATDPMIEANYSAEDLSGKAACKAALQRELGLPERDVPLITMVSRLVAPKGLDLVRETMDAILTYNDVQFVLLGTGDAEYEDFFRGLEFRHGDKVRALITFDNALSHRIYSAGDILLVPSRSEPCGLTQMIGCRYADVPLVRRTGGLGDTISDCSCGDGNGFVFDQFTAGAFEGTVKNAINKYWDRENWAKLQKYDIGLDFSWDYSADRYIELYKELEQ